MTLSKESWVLLGICLVDLVFTLMLLNTQAATEGNPIMSFFLKFGIGTFIMAKLTLTFLPVFIFEYSMRFCPKFTRTMLRSTIAAYLGIYLVLYLGINVRPLAGPRQDVPVMQVTQADILR